MLETTRRVPINWAALRRLERLLDASQLRSLGSARSAVRRMRRVNVGGTVVGGNRREKMIQWGSQTLLGTQSTSERLCIRARTRACACVCCCPRRYLFIYPFIDWGRRSPTQRSSSWTWPRCHQAGSGRTTRWAPSHPVPPPLFNRNNIHVYKPQPETFRTFFLIFPIPLNRLRKTAYCWLKENPVVMSVLYIIYIKNVCHSVLRAKNTNKKNSTTWIWLLYLWIKWFWY